ncbi:unnamed protein product [Ceratitis capitata]|uniref:(Mediterranean fruit fly) hypothetical protein n=1 Tax=Ceratitis capitata TaxID=7213 RepID=A0A811UEW0_CERCA|nr:unnamed protein product [Ceratitis capitata]
MLSSLWKKGANFLGSDFAIMGGAMSWVSERSLVSAISNAGGFGVIACGAMSPDLLKKEIMETQKLTNKPFGVNLITMHPNLNKLIDICIETKEVFIKSAARNAVSSVQISADFPVIPVRAIANKASDDFMKHQKEIIDKYQKGQISKEDGQLEIEKFWSGALRRAVIEGDVETGSLMAGQSVGMVDREKPVKEVVNMLIQQADSYIESKSAEAENPAIRKANS